MDAQEYKTFISLVPLLFDNPISSCWDHFHPCDCFYVASLSCMKADTTNNIWGGWRTSDVKIASVLILFSKWRHISSWTQGQDSRRWMAQMLLFFCNSFFSIYLDLLWGDIFMSWSFMYRHFTYRPFHLSRWGGKEYQVFTYIEIWKERHMHTCTAKWGLFEKHVALVLLNIYLLSFQKKGLFWARGMMFIIILMSRANAIHISRWYSSGYSYSQVALTCCCCISVYSNYLSAVIHYYLYLFIWLIIRSADMEALCSLLCPEGSSVYLLNISTNTKFSMPGCKMHFDNTSFAWSWWMEQSLHFDVGKK